MLPLCLTHPCTWLQGRGLGNWCTGSKAERLSSPPQHCCLLAVWDCLMGTCQSFLKGPDGPYLGFAHRNAFPTTQFCHFSTRAVGNNMQMNEHGCVPIKLFPETGSPLLRHNWPLPTLILPVQGQLSTLITAARAQPSCSKENCKTVRKQDSLPVR